MRLLGVLVIIFWADWVMALPACYPTPISSATTISSSGIYNLINDISGTISVTANNVDLDLCSYSVDAGGAASAISVTSNDVVVHNGTVSGAANQGLLVSGAERVTLHDIRALNNTGAVGISFAASNTCCSIQDSIATGNATGFQDLGASATRVGSCTACHNTGDGFLFRADQLVIADCQAKANGSDGFSVSGTGFSIDHSKAMENSGNGIHLTSASGVATGAGVIDQATISGNGADGIAIDADTEIVSSILINECSIVGNTSDGIGVTASSTMVTDCQILDCKISANGSNGILLPTTPGLAERFEIIGNQILRNGVGIAGPVFGINIGGGVFVPGGAGATATSHEVFNNRALQNGTNAPSAITTNYSNNVQASPSSGPNPNGLVVSPAAGVGFLENLSS